MKKISIDAAEPGMKLARSIANDSGMILFGEGTVLKEQSIQRIKAINVDYISIEGFSAPKTPLASELASLDLRFSKSINNPYMYDIKKMVTEHIKSLYEAS